MIPTTTKPAPRRASPTDCCRESECDSGLKNHYFPGKRITPEMFRVEQTYHVERRRLLNRAIHGWGVVYGYSVKVVPPPEPAAPPAAAQQQPAEPVLRKLVIGKGLALDECGRELLHVGPATIEAASASVNWKQRTHSHAATHQERRYKCLRLDAHYAERFTGRAKVPDLCFCDHDEWDRKCETVYFTLTEVDCDEDCTPKPCGPEDTFDPHRCDDICRNLIGTSVHAECKGHLHRVEDPCGDVLYVDLDHWVSIACVRAVDDGCGGWTFGETVDECAPRRHVKRNDLLFDLIPGCDLTSIKEIGWADWHRNPGGKLVPFNDFVYALGFDGNLNSRIATYRSGRFYVEFTRPVRTDTLRPDCFAMTICSPEYEGGWWEPLRVPIVDLEYIPKPADPKNPPPLVRGARIIVGGPWMRDALAGEQNRFGRFNARVEFLIHGDLISDCEGKSPDLNAVGILADRSGNGSPGGTFISPFTLTEWMDSVRSEPTGQKTGA